MAHFAKISEDKKVLEVLTLNDSDMLNANGVEDEAVGQAHLQKHNNWPANQWIQTSYNTFCNKHKEGKTPLRGNYAGVGYTWDEINQIFWPEKPYNSWVQNILEARWQSPIGDEPEFTQEQINQNMASTHKWRYEWNEDSQIWELKDKLIEI